MGENARTSRRVEVFVDPTLGTGNAPLSVSWETHDPSDPVRAIHVWLPGMEGVQQPFWPPFLEKVRATNAGRGPATWRTLDWTRVNEYGRALRHGGFVFDRAGVITPASPTQGSLRGVATEYQVALCNALGMDLHLQLPHRTDDLSESDWVLFVEGELRKVRDGSRGVPGLYGGRPFDGLDPRLTVTVELSNEIWNSLFPVSAWMSAEAARRGLTFSQQIASQVQLVFDIAESVFAGPDRVRLRTFVGGFTPDPGYTRRLLAELNPGTRVDALGPATYLGPRRPDMDAWLDGSSPGTCPNCPDVDELLATARNTLAILRPQVAEHRDVALGWTNPDGSHPLLEAYEAGINLKSDGQPWAAAARALQTDPRLFGLLANEFVPMLVREGVCLVNWYSFMTDQDALGLDAYGFWNDMAQDIGLPITRPYVHRGAPKAAMLCLGPPLPASCPRASATVRTVPGNFQSLTCTPPVLGTVFRAAVDVTTSGDTSAFVVASLRPAAIPLPSGQMLLLSLDDGELLGVRPGPIATWEVPVPNDWRLAGIHVWTQAFHLGAGSGLDLSNAMELEIGR